MTENYKAAAIYQKIKAQMAGVIVGKGDIEEALMLALVAGGHVLIEGLPGTAKTKIARTFAGVVGGEFKRIQFTPDMMPADITGFYVYSSSGDYRFIPGPVFANIILADELNRTTPRTQSALLEAMQEHQVTIEGESRPLPLPFMVIATQVYAGAEGTYPLTDVQLDRFLLRVTSEYSSKDEEKQIIANIDRIDEAWIENVVSMEEISQLQENVKKVQVAEDIVEYVTSLTKALREDPDVISGPSTRASIALYKCARVLALLDGRDFVIPDDIKQLVFLAIEHRIQSRPEAEMDDITPRVILNRVLEKVPVPRLQI